MARTAQTWRPCTRAAALSHAPPELDAATSGHAVVLRLAAGSCTITATAEALHVRAEAESLDGLAKIQNGITNRITKIGRRDNLAVAWSEPEAKDVVDFVPKALVRKAAEQRS